MDRSGTAAPPTRYEPPTHLADEPLARRPGRGAFTHRDTLLFALGIIGLLTLPFVVPALRLLVVRPLWLDELHTLILARELPGALLVERLARGADFNPPLLFVLDAAMLRLLPGIPEQVTLRLTSIIAVGVTAILLYRVSRQRLGALPAAVGTVGLLSHPVLMVQLHEARFYALWLMLTVFVATSVERLVERPDSRWRFARLALAVALTSMAHYFGVISLACMAVALLLDQRVRAHLRRLAAAVAVGLLPLAAWSPIYLAQRHVLSVATWVPRPDIDSLSSFINGHYVWLPFAFVLVGVAAYELIARRGVPDERPALGVAQVGLLGLLAMPIAIVAFSLVIQPALVQRYALPAVAGFACVAAIGVERLPVPVQRFLLAGAVVLYWWSLVGRLPDAAEFAQDVRGRRDAAMLAAGDARPIVTLDRNVLYPVALPAGTPDLRLRYLVVPSDTLRAFVASRIDPPLSSEHLIVERDAALAHNGLFGFPAVMALDSLRRQPEFLLLTDERAGSWFTDLFPGHAGCQARPYLVLFRARAEGRHAVSSAPPTCDVAAADAAPVR